MPVGQHAHVPVPFPCAVYRRDRASVPYRFSHFCDCSVIKKFPGSLRVTDLRAHDPLTNWMAMRNAAFLVLVAGDVAQCISVSTDLRKRTAFLYHGSRFTRVGEGSADVFATEFHESYVPIFFFGTLCSFDRRGAFRSAIPLEASVCLLPRCLVESDLPRLVKWAETAILKSVHSSVWLTDAGSAYHEHTLRESSRNSRGKGIHPPARTSVK